MENQVEIKTPKQVLASRDPNEPPYDRIKRICQTTIDLHFEGTEDETVNVPVGKADEEVLVRIMKDFGSKGWKVSRTKDRWGWEMYFSQKG